MEHLWQDLRYAGRGLVAHPWIAAVAVATLAVGIAVNTVLFSVINGVLLKGPAPGAAEKDRLARVYTGARGNPYGETSHADFADLAAETRTLDLAAEGFLPLGASADGRAVQVWTLFVSPNYFSVLEVRPAVGRLLDTADAARGDAVAVVSPAYWRRALGASPDLTGRTVVLNGRRFAVVGVVPEGFHGPGGIYVPDVWVPLSAARAVGLPAGRLGREDRWLRLVGRLRDGASLPQAQAEMATLAERLAAAYPAADRDRVGTVTPLTPGDPDEYRGMLAGSALALGATGLVLLIACFNVASLILARAVDRRREMGIRASLGATRWRLARQLVTESLVLAALAGVGGLLVSIWSRSLLGALAIPAPIPQAIDVGPDARTIWFVVALVLVAGLVPGLVPALHASRPDLAVTLKAGGLSGGTRPSRLRDVFLVLQIAGSTAFLVLAALFVQSYAHTARADVGFEAGHLVVMTVDPQLHGYDGPRARALFEALRDRVAALPGVGAAALTSWVPFSVGGVQALPVATGGRDCSAGGCPAAIAVAVTPGYPAALGVAILEGRDLGAGDRGTSNAVVSRGMADSLWPGSNPVGETFYTGAGRERRAWQVVGVVPDVATRAVGWPAQPFFCRPLVERDTGGDRSVWLMARTSGDPRSLIEPVRDALASIDPALPAAQLETMEDHLRLPLWPGRVLLAFFTLCGVVALLFASVGLAGVTHYAVEQRTREFGVRLALGATGRQVMRAVLRDGVRLAAIGAGIGLACAWTAARLLAASLNGISPSDPGTYAAAAITQALVAILAGLVPAVRATRVDPVRALRQE